MFQKRFFIPLLAVLIVLAVVLVTSKVPKSSQSILDSKVYECLKIDKDIYALKNHIEEHYDLIDHFVLLEYLEKGKEPIYSSHKALFEGFEDKISYVLTSFHQPDEGSMDLNNQFLNALEGCRDQDIVIFPKSSQHLKAEDLYQGLIWLQEHPQKFLLLPVKSSAKSLDHLKATTFLYLKQSPEIIPQETNRLKNQKNLLKSAFFPKLQPKENL